MLAWGASGRRFVPNAFGSHSRGKEEVHYLRGVVQLASMLAWGASGRRFESCHSDTKVAGSSRRFSGATPTKKRVSLQNSKLTLFLWVST